MNWTVTALTEFVQRVVAQSTPLKPAFNAYNSAQDANATGDGTAFTVDFDTIAFDQHGDFAADTFTAPVTGRYLLNTIIEWSGGTGSTTAYTINIITSNKTYKAFQTVGSGSITQGAYSGTVIADMDAGDTATIQFAVTNGTKVIDVNPDDTLFSGVLIS